MFAKLTATNFFSWESLEFDFRSGVTMITGNNIDDNTSEGSGKSSIPNALCWALYGQLPKDINIDDVIKTGEKHCVVEVELEDGTFIVRARKPNQLYIQNNGSVQTGKDMKDTQKLINELLGMSFDTFLQSVYFAQNYSNKFITANQEQKAKILSELQDLSIFDRSIKRSNDMLKTANSELSILDIKLSEKTLSYNYHVNNINSMEQLSSNFNNSQVTKLELLNAKHEELTKKVKALESEIIPIDGIPYSFEELEQLTNSRNEISRQLYYIEQLKLKKTQAEQDQVCPTCNKPLDKQNMCLDIPDDSALLKGKEYLDTEITRLTSEGKELANKKLKNDQLVSSLNTLKAQEHQISIEVKSLELNKDPYVELIDKSKVQAKTLEVSLIDLRQQYETNKKQINYLQFLKEGFKEIKSYVFQSLLSELNNKANKYLKQMFDVSAYITFDNVSSDGEVNKIETKVLLDGYERSLGLLSGGQFRRVQLAVDFALSEIVAQRSKNPINIRILDEAFKDLSFSSMEKLVDILQKMPGSTILIEHNELVKSIVTNTFEVELKGGTSYAN